MDIIEHFLRVRFLQACIILFTFQHYEVSIVQSLNWLFFFLTRQLKLRELEERILNHIENKRWRLFNKYHGCFVLVVQWGSSSLLSKEILWMVKEDPRNAFLLKHGSRGLFLTKGGNSQRRMRERRGGWHKCSQRVPFHQSISFTLKGKVNSE